MSSIVSNISTKSASKQQPNSQQLRQASSMSVSSSASPQAKHTESNQFAAGLVSGLIVAGLFSPWDRALYLSVSHERRFLDKRNFQEPFRGFFQALFLRTLSSGLYFPLYDLFAPRLQKFVNDKIPIEDENAENPQQQRHPILLHFLAGNSAGAVSGALLNQLTAVKYATWESEKGGFIGTATTMWKQGGFRPFFNGIGPTVARDTVFGGVFAVTKEGMFRLMMKFQSNLTPYMPARYSSFNKTSTSSIHDGNSSAAPQASLKDAHELQLVAGRYKKLADFIASLTAGALGTVMSSPLNYARNIKFSWPAYEQSPSSYEILRRLLNEARTKDRPFDFLQSRMRIGWGTARVAVGMAVGYEVYDYAKRFLNRVH